MSKGFSPIFKDKFTGKIIDLPLQKHILKALETGRLKKLDPAQKWLESLAIKQLRLLAFFQLPDDPTNLDEDCETDILSCILMLAVMETGIIGEVELTVTQLLTYRDSLQGLAFLVLARKLNFIEFNSQIFMTSFGEGEISIKYTMKTFLEVIKVFEGKHQWRQDRSSYLSEIKKYVFSNP